MSEHTWAAILAGGNGTRLRPLTRLIAGRERPKQFCTIFGGRSLLSQTRLRLERAIPPERTLFAVVKEHEPFYAQELSDVSPSHIIVQPFNKGTTAAIAYSLLRIARLDRNAIVGFFPTDHYYANESFFLSAVETAFRAAEEHAGRVILLGAQPRHAEVEYGWIEPGFKQHCLSGSGLFGVNRFWEKPSLRVATALLSRGCLWNTFVMVGHHTAFIEALVAAAPEVLGALVPASLERNVALETKRVRQCYRDFSGGDFSRDVLPAWTDRLSVLRLGDVGWNDLGTPERVHLAMLQAGLVPSFEAPIGLTIDRKEH